MSYPTLDVGCKMSLHSKTVLSSHEDARLCCCPSPLCASSASACLSVCLIMALVALLGSLSFELRSFVALSVVISGVCSAAAAAAAKWSRSLFKRVFKSRPSFKLSRAREEGKKD